MHKEEKYDRSTRVVKKQIGEDSPIYAFEIKLQGEYTVLVVCQIVHCASDLSFLTAVCLIRQRFVSSGLSIDFSDSDLGNKHLRISFLGSGLVFLLHSGLPFLSSSGLAKQLQESRVNILRSIDEGPFQIGMFREILAEGKEGAIHLCPERPRVYSDLSLEEKDRVDRIQVRGIMHEVQVQLVMGELKTELGMLQVKQGRLSATTATENEVALGEEQLLFIAGGQDNVVDEDVDEQPIQDLALNVDNVFQADDCDAIDSDVDEAPIAQTMFMANLSSVDLVYDEAGPSYDSNILSEVHDHDHYHDAVYEHHDVHEMHDDVQPNYVVDLHADYTSDSNMINM
nr:retrovirus-related Pol polyprotein from transposon TNT 1-94 [Tanacetum cinerariifolium]